MKIAIHNSKIGFHPRWIDYCIKNALEYKIVDCYANDIVKQLSDCKALLWHYNHTSHRDMMIAQKILFALEHTGFSVFPDFSTAWHFDDKVAQKYLLERIHAPLVNSYAFFDKTAALQWVENTSFPKVCKLKGGAGSANVKLVKHKQQAIQIVNKAFGKGFKQYDKWQNLKDRYKKYKLKKTTSFDVLKGVVRLFIEPEYSVKMGYDSGYVYFQDFIPNQDSDIRIIVVGDKAFGIKRMVRKGDFRASGSGEIYYEKNMIREDCVQLAFKINEQLKTQSIAFDFIFDENNKPLIVEISYGFLEYGYDACTGYWDKDLNWHEGKFNPYGWMIENLLQ